MQNNDKTQIAKQKINFWKDNFENWGAFATIFIFGFTQEFVIKNLQLLIFLPNQFPFFELGHWIIDLVLSCIASTFLLLKARNFKTKAWWFSFLCMAIPFLYLKYLGVYYDNTNYLIASAQGRHIGGGAAFGHLFLMFYILGSAQLLSWIGFCVSDSTERKNFTLSAKKYIKNILGMTNKE